MFEDTNSLGWFHQAKTLAFRIVRILLVVPSGRSQEMGLVCVLLIENFVYKTTDPRPSFVVNVE